MAAFAKKGVKKIIFSAWTYWHFSGKKLINALLWQSAVTKTFNPNFIFRYHFKDHIFHLVPIDKFYVQWFCQCEVAYWRTLVLALFWVMRTYIPLACPWIGVALTIIVSPSFTSSHSSQSRDGNNRGTVSMQVNVMSKGQNITQFVINQNNIRW